MSSTLESSSPWPISGGRPVGTPKIAKSDFENVLLTGHEDGSVRIWRLYSNMMSEIAKVTTMKYFNTGSFQTSSIFSIMVIDSSNMISGMKSNLEIYLPTIKILTFENESLNYDVITPQLGDVIIK